MPFKFEKLEVWQLALDYSDLIYDIADQLPHSEAYNLRSQITRAATSVALNIAEGSTGQTDAEQARFYRLGHSFSAGNCRLPAHDQPSPISPGCNPSPPGISSGRDIGSQAAFHAQGHRTKPIMAARRVYCVRIGECGIADMWREKYDRFGRVRPSSFVLRRLSREDP
jgi:hypothetical protein